MKNILNSLKRIIVNATINIGNFFKMLSKIVWNYFLFYIYMFFNIIFKFVFKYLIKTPSTILFNYILKPTYKGVEAGTVKVYSILKKVALFIYSNFIYKIFLGLKHVLKYIKKLFNLIGIGIKNIFKYINSFFVKVYLTIKFIYYKTPDFLYNLVYLLFIYTYLIIHFIVIETVFVIFIKIPYKLFYKLFNVAANLFIKFFTWIFKGFKLIYIYVKKFFYKLYLIFRDFNEYFVVIILIPLLLPIFILSTIIVLIAEVPKYFNIIFKGIIGRRVYSDHELLSVKYRYNPIKTMYLNNYSYYIDLKIGDVKLTNVKQLINNLKIINNRFIYNLIILPTITILLSPLLIFKIFRRDNEINKHDLIILNTTTNGIIYTKPIKIGKNILRVELLTDYTNLIIDNLYIVNSQEKKIKINILINNEVVQELTLNYVNDEFTNGLNLLNEITILLQKEKYYKFELPKLEGDYIVSYNKVYKRDDINDNVFTLRSGFTFTDIKVIIKKDNTTVLEQIVNIKGLNNIKDLNKAIKAKILINPNDYLSNYLPKQYDYSFIESIYIDKEGKILTEDNINFEAKFYIVGFENYIYNVKIEVLANELKLFEYIKSLEENFLDLENEIIMLNDLVISDSYEKEVIYYINNEEIRKEYDYSIAYNKIMSDPNAEISIMFLFNGKYIYKKLNIEREITQLDLLSEVLGLRFKYKDNIILINNFNVREIFKNKNYISFPKLIKDKLYIVRWKSLNKKLIKSTGYIINNDFKEVEFKIVVYKKLFKKKTYEVKLYNKIKIDNINPLNNINLE